MKRTTADHVDRLGQLVFRLETNLSTLTNNTIAMKGKEKIASESLTALDEDLEKLKQLKAELYDASFELS